MKWLLRTSNVLKVMRTSASRAGDSCPDDHSQQQAVALEVSELLEGRDLVDRQRTLTGDKPIASRFRANLASPLGPLLSAMAIQGWAHGRDAPASTCWPIMSCLFRALRAEGHGLRACLLPASLVAPSRFLVAEAMRPRRPKANGASMRVPVIDLRCPHPCLNVPIPCLKPCPLHP